MRRNDAAEPLKLTRAGGGQQSRPARASGFSSGEIRGKVCRMATPFICLQCHQPEGQCKCEVKHYCVLCQGEHNVRLVQDGNYYCLDCREACDYQAQHKEAGA